MAERVIEAAVRYREELLPAHHESHGTPHPILAVSTPGNHCASTRGCKQTLKSYGR